MRDRIIIISLLCFLLYSQHRLGFTDKEIVALSGAHALGRCHTDASGYWGPWTRAETTFSNEYFRLLLEEKWTLKKKHEGKPWKGPAQYETKDGALMMLPSDLALIEDPAFKKYVELFAKDEDLFFKGSYSPIIHLSYSLSSLHDNCIEFSSAFSKLLQAGVPAPAPKKGLLW